MLLVWCCCCFYSIILFFRFRRSSAYTTKKNAHNTPHQKKKLYTTAKTFPQIAAKWRQETRSDRAPFFDSTDCTREWRRFIRCCCSCWNWSRRTACRSHVSTTASLVVRLIEHASTWPPSCRTRNAAWTDRPPRGPSPPRTCRRPSTSLSVAWAAPALSSTSSKFCHYSLRICTVRIWPYSKQCKRYVVKKSQTIL